MTAICPKCDREAQEYFNVGDLNQRLFDAIFNYYRCPACKVIFISPIPNNLSDYYTPTYPAYKIPGIAELSAIAEQERYKIDIVKEFKHSGRLLEIGPAYGGFSYLAKQAGFQVDAIEMSAQCCKFLNEVVGVRTVNSTDIVSAIHDLGSYDVIALWHVLEHLPEPWAVLKAISEKLLPGGIVVIAAPNPAALQFRIFGRYWTHVDAPRHLQLIPSGFLREQMELYGLKPLLITTSDQASKIFSTYGWWMVSFENFLKNAFPYKVGKFVKKRVLRALYSIALKPLESINGLGNAYTAIFKK